MCNKRCFNTEEEASSRLYYVYRHLKKGTNEVFYVGVSKDKKRSHYFKGRSNLWNNFYKKYEVDVEIMITDLKKEEAFELEIFLISLYGRLDNKTGTLVNLTDGGEGICNVSPEAALKISVSKRGDKNPMWGSKLSEGQKNKILESVAKKVISVNDGNIYNSIEEASKHLNIPGSVLGAYLNKNRKNKTAMLFLDDVVSNGVEINGVVHKNIKSGLFIGGNSDYVNVKHNIYPDEMFIGKSFTTTQGYIIRVLSRTDKNKYVFIFNDEFNTIGTNYKQRIIKGNVINSNHRTINKIGYVGYGVYKTSSNKKPTKYYSIWAHFIKQLYDEDGKRIGKYSISEKWHNFQSFAEWCDKNYREHWELDTNILENDDFVYSEINCCFAPRVLKTLFFKNGYKNIRRFKNKFQPRLFKFGKELRLGSFTSLTEAKNVLQKEKDSLKIETILMYKQDLDERIVKKFIV